MKSIFLFGLLALSFHSFSQDCKLRISGHVHSTVTHENLASASITLNGRPVIITDVHGDFVFDALCPGIYSIIITHAGFQPVTREVDLQKNLHLDLDLQPLKGELEEVVLTGPTRSADQKTLQGRELQIVRGQPLAEALSRIAGVTTLQTGTTISKPVIHGLHSNRILTINNGVRQEGQQWGNEHAPEIDPFIADQLSIVKGVDELRYGSDAIGGVVLVNPRALREDAGYRAEANLQYFTNNRQYVSSILFEHALKTLPAFAYRIQGTFRKGASVRAPGYSLNNTALDEGNFSLTTRYKREHFSTELYFSHFDTRVGIFSGSHVGNLTDLQNAIASDRPADVFINNNSYKIGRPYQDVKHDLLRSRSVFDLGRHRFTVQLAVQHNNRKEFDKLRSNSNTKGPQLDLSVYTFSEEILYEMPLIGKLKGMAGISAQQQDNAYRGRYLIPNYFSSSMGAFLIQKWTSGPLEFGAGIRGDIKDIQTTRLQSGSQTFDRYDFDFSTFASSLTAAYRFTNAFRINALASISSRAPNVNELLTDGVHHGTGTYEQGSLNLVPEKSFYLSLGGELTADKVQASLTVYRNRIRDFIYLQPRPAEPVLTIRGAFPKSAYTSTDAVLQGMDLSFGYRLGKFDLLTRYAHLRAKDLDSADWLIAMPADRASGQLTYNFSLSKSNAAFLSAEVQHVFEQTRVPSDKWGPRDYKQPPPAYTLLNAYASYSTVWGRFPIEFTLTARNLLNLSYRDYLNSFRYFTDEMGRNVGVRVRVGLESKRQ